MTADDTKYRDGWIKAAPDRLERNEWTILKTQDSNGGLLYLLFRGRTARGDNTECVERYDTAQDAIDFVKTSA